MSVASTSLVTQLLYPAVPDLDLRRVIAELSKLFKADKTGSPVLAWDCDDIAVLDFADVRIVVGFSILLTGSQHACLTVAVGSPPLKTDMGMAVADRQVISLAVTECLQSQHPTDNQRSFSVDFAPTPDLIDHLVETLCKDLTGSPSELTPDAVSAPPTDMPEAVDMDRLLHRLSSELTARAPSLITRAIASATQAGRKSTGEESAAAKNKGGVFWRKGAISPTPIMGQDHVRPAPHVANTGELKAVRDALYAADASAGSRVAATTKRALRSLIARGADKNRGNQIKQ